MTAKKKRPLRKSYAGVAPWLSAKTKDIPARTIQEIEADDYHQWQAKLRAAQEALTAAERPTGFHEWLSPRQKYTVLDHIDEMMEEVLHDIRYAPGLHIAPGLPDLTPALNLLLAELRGRIMRRLHLEKADEQLRHALGSDRS
jgi:hypothetical protein